MNKGIRAHIRLFHVSGAIEICKVSMLVSCVCRKECTPTLLTAHTNLNTGRKECIPTLFAA